MSTLSDSYLVFGNARELPLSQGPEDLAIIRRRRVVGDRAEPGHDTYDTVGGICRLLWRHMPPAAGGARVRRHEPAEAVLRCDPERE